MLLREKHYDRTVAEILIKAGARLSDEFIIAAARNCNRNLVTWFKVHQELDIPTGVSLALESACRAITSAGSTFPSSSSFEVPAAVAASPERLHELMCVMLCCLQGSGRYRYASEQPLAVQLLQQHSATAAQWTPAQMLQMLKLCMQYQLRYVLQALVQQVAVPAIQQQQLSQQQVEELLYLGTDLMLLDVLWPLCPEPLPKKLLLQLMQHAASSSEAARSIDILVQQPEARQLTAGDVFKVLLQLAVVSPPFRLDYEPDPLQLVFQQVPAARALPVAIAEQLLRAAVMRGSKGTPEVICSSLPSAQQLSVEVVKDVIGLGIERADLPIWGALLQPVEQLSVGDVDELLSAAIRADANLGWVCRLPQAAAFTREMLLQHVHLVIDVEHMTGGAVLACLPAIATFTAADVEGVVRAAIAACSDRWKEAAARSPEERPDKLESPCDILARIRTPCCPSMNRVAQELLDRVPSSNQLPAAVVFEWMQQLADLAAVETPYTGYTSNTHVLWSVVTSLPGVKQLLFDKVYQLLQLAARQQLKLEPLLQLRAGTNQLSVAQLVALLHEVEGAGSSECSSSSRSTARLVQGMQQLLSLPVAQQLTADQVYPLLLSNIGRLGAHFLKLPSVVAFSAEQVVQLAEALREQQPAGAAGSGEEGEAVADAVQLLLQLPAAEHLQEGLVCDLLLLILQQISADSCCYGTSWGKLQWVAAVQQLPLDQLMRLLEVGFRQGRVPGALWRLPAAQMLTVEQLQQLVVMGEVEEQREGGERGVGSSIFSFKVHNFSCTLLRSKSKSLPGVRARYGWGDMAVLPAAKQLGAGVVLQLLQSALVTEAMSVNLLVELPAAGDIEAAQVEQLMRWALDRRSDIAQVLALAGLRGAMELGNEDIWGLVQLAMGKMNSDGMSKLLLLPWAKGLSEVQAKQLLEHAMWQLMYGADSSAKLSSVSSVLAVLQLPAATGLEVGLLQRLLVQLARELEGDSARCGSILGYKTERNPSEAWALLAQVQLSLMQTSARAMELMLLRQPPGQHQHAEGVRPALLLQGLEGVVQSAAACPKRIETLMQRLDDKGVHKGPPAAQYSGLVKAVEHCYSTSTSLISYLKAMNKSVVDFGGSAAAGDSGSVDGDAPGGSYHDAAILAVAGGAATEAQQVAETVWRLVNVLKTSLSSLDNVKVVLLKHPLAKTLTEEQR